MLRSGYSSALCLLVLFGLLPSMSCKSHGLAPVSPDDPYAEYAPKTKEEEAYYQDVYSGNWQKSPNPMGELGLGKMFAGTKPPEHWSMEPPHGAKSMAQIYEENYQKQMAAAGYGNNAPSGSNPAAGANTAVAMNPNGSAYPTAGTAYGNAALQNGTTPASDQKGESPNFIGPTKKEDSQEVKTYDKPSGFSKFLNGWTWSLPAQNDNFGYPFLLRGQDASTDSAGSSENLTSDPSLSDSWRTVNREGLKADSEKKHEPQDEYIADGGDDGSAAYVRQDGEIRYLEPEDTVASFETADGQKMIEPSNRVHLYSPRFGSVRQVFGVESDTQGLLLHSAGTEVGPMLRETQAGIDVRSQEEQVSLSRSKLSATGTAAHQPGGALAVADGTIVHSGQVKVGDLGAQMMTGDAKILERLYSADSALAIGTWGEIQEVAVEIDKNSAQGMVRIDQAQAVFVVETETKTSKLQLFKMASKKDAAPGELVEFAIRYENISSEPIETVSILDNLSARLEYVEGSAKSSQNSTFTVSNNQAGSNLLKWEITEPLAPHQYGVISFLCRVR